MALAAIAHRLSVFKGRKVDNASLGLDSARGSSRAITPAWPLSAALSNPQEWHLA